ncbi:MAG: hypothetical protein WC989_03665 [Micavibrio sp.]
MGLLAKTFGDEIGFSQIEGNGGISNEGDGGIRGECPDDVASFKNGLPPSLTPGGIGG